MDFFQKLLGIKKWKLWMWCFYSSGILYLLKSVFRRNNGGDDDGSYHDDVGQMRRAQSIDSSGPTHHWSTHVGDGHRQRACREKRTARDRLGVKTRGRESSERSVCLSVVRKSERAKDSIL